MSFKQINNKGIDCTGQLASEYNRSVLIMPEVPMCAFPGLLGKLISLGKLPSRLQWSYSFPSLLLLQYLQLHGCLHFCIYQAEKPYSMYLASSHISHIMKVSTNVFEISWAFKPVNIELSQILLILSCFYEWNVSFPFISHK